jgi:hypothetical protein
MPTSKVPFGKSRSFEIPKEKRIIVFNHRWSQSTGINKFLEYTEPLLKDDRYLLWVTDPTAMNLPSGYYRSNLSYDEYQYLLQNSYCSVCFLDGYATWNLSVQDGISLNKPVLVYKHPVMDAILGENYPYYFETASEFKRLLETVPTTFEWTIPKHDEIFKNNLIHSMEECVVGTYKVREDDLNWIYCILNGLTYKGEITGQVQPTIGLNSNWQYIRRWMLVNGVIDNPNSPYPCYEIADEAKEKLQKLVEGIKMDIRPGDKKKPIMIRKDNPFF